MNMAEQKNMLWGERRRNEPMARHTSWRAGGSVDRAYFPVDLEDMRLFMASLPADEPLYLVGLGSNLLVRDGGLRGTVIFTHGALKEIRFEGNALYAESGVPSPKLARFAALHELVGAEFMAGIPGTVGGALAMNAGCYGGEAWGIVESVTTLDRKGQLRQRTPANYEIGYRRVVLLERVEEWFAAARFRLQQGDGGKSRATIKQLLERRIAAQPLNLPNAGSVFRNPPNDYAARMIEACGLKGRVQGGAMISGKHANFIVNTGGATAADIEALINLAHATVKEKLGIDLEREVRIVGERA
ncbi:MAG: UDP-N-acetylenolpyruvoylglucosamine reductase [Betaproteobacteria bacterium]|nr:UDP-N-acetylenolpyruvoylglucosamine reductase [Betaproteobacteria bacterium]